MISDIYDERIRAAAAQHCAEPLADFNAEITLDNPFCGDRVVVQARLEEGRYIALRGVADGCLLCRASTTVATSRSVGITHEEALAVLASLRALLEGRVTEAEVIWPELGIFMPLVTHRNRRKCVLLPFEALEQIGRR